MACPSVTTPNDGHALIGAPQARRLLFSLIDAWQETRRRDGRADPGQSLVCRAADLSPEALDAVTMDEEDLGLDSLARLDLVGTLTRYFNLDTTGVEDYLLVRRSFGDWAGLVAHHFEGAGASAELTLRTSGSTGDPKPARHTAAALRSEVAAIAQTALREARPARVLSQVAPHHAYGLIWGVLLPHHLDVTAHDLPRALPGPVLRMAQPGDLVLCTPFGWERLAETGRRLPEGVTGVTSGAPATPATWSCGETLGLARMIEVYGATETGGIGWRDTPRAPFRVLADLTREKGGALRRPGHPHPLAVQDRLDWIGDRQFTVQGRIDSVVQVAGVNVAVAELRDALRTVDGVQDAAVRLSCGRLKVFVQRPPHLCDATLEAALRGAVRAFPPPARPVRYAFGAALPRDAQGKLIDWEEAS